MGKLTPMKAIRKKCLDCCCGSSNEVSLCTVTKCSLYAFRFGKNPNRAGLGCGNPNFKKEAYSTNEFHDKQE